MCFFHKTPRVSEPIRIQIPPPVHHNVRSARVIEVREMIVREYRVRISDARPAAADRKTDRRFTFYKHETGETPER